MSIITNLNEPESTYPAHVIEELRKNIEMDFTVLFDMLVSTIVAAKIKIPDLIAASKNTTLKNKYSKALVTGLDDEGDSDETKPVN